MAAGAATNPLTSRKSYSSAAEFTLTHMTHNHKAPRGTEVTVAFQGEKGAFSEAAVYKYLGPPRGQVRTLPQNSLSRVIQAVTEGKSRYGIIPVENSIGGYVDRAYELIAGSKLTAIGEVYLEVKHNLLGIPGTNLEDIDTVYSHPQALKQCRTFVEEGGFSTRATYDTAGSAKMISENRQPNEGAIASELAAREYDLKTLAEGIQSAEDNYTRFLVLSASKVQEREGGVDYKTSVTFDLGDSPGALYHCLIPFAENEINLTMIKSRPSISGNWEYHFDLELEGHRDDPVVATTLDAVNEYLPNSVTVLGSYPQGKK